jgi:membrane fusion protein, multidrug efflux system
VSSRKTVARIVGIVIVGVAILTGLITLWQTNVHPRTDDATVRANLIGMAPEVSGPIMKLYVKDNQYVKQGDPLYDIDPRPYEYALEKAFSDQRTLEEKIRNEERVIAGEQSAVVASQAGVATSEANVHSADAAVNAAEAAVKNAQAGVARAEAEYKFATDTLHRVEPLLQKQFVTVDDIDRAQTRQVTAQEAVNQARAQLALSQAQLQSALAQRNQSHSGLAQSNAQLQRSSHDVTLIEPLTAQRGAMAAAVRNAQYNLDHCKVVAPFDARVTDMNISEGEYAHEGQRVFTLIDVRTWWVIANYRESQLKYIRPGMPADVYVMTKPSQRFQGVVDSVTYGVFPEDGGVALGLPQVQRTLNWVHLATRVPVRVRVENPVQDLYRIGESAVVIVRGEQSAAR